MGCDIHAYKEKYNKDSQKWESLDVWEKEEDEDYTSYFTINVDALSTPRNYIAFGFLTDSRVRREVEDSIPYLGYPKNPSFEVDRHYRIWDVDAHTPNYILLKDLKEKATEMLITPNPETEYITPFISSWINSFGEISDPENYRIVFWFDT